MLERAPFFEIALCTDPLHGEIFRMYLLARALRILQFVVYALIRLVANGNNV